MTTEEAAKGLQTAGYFNSVSVSGLPRNRVAWSQRKEAFLRRKKPAQQTL
jgi:hypothetical protein